MCTGKCSRCVAVTLYPLALISIICNIVLFFPGGDVKYAQDGHITEEVKYMGGLVGGGIMVLLPALYIHLTGTQGCCGNRCGVSLKTLFQEFSEKRALALMLNNQWRTLGVSQSRVNLLQSHYFKHTPSSSATEVPMSNILGILPSAAYFVWRNVEMGLDLYHKDKATLSQNKAKL